MSETDMSNRMKEIRERLANTAKRLRDEAEYISPRSKECSHCDASVGYQCDACHTASLMGETAFLLTNERADVPFLLDAYEELRARLASVERVVATRERQLRLALCSVCQNELAELNGVPMTTNSSRIHQSDIDAIKEAINDADLDGEIYANAKLEPLRRLLSAYAAVEKEREELKLKLAREDRAHEITIGQRDAFEEFIGDMAHGFEPDAEWSNLCDLRDVVSDGIDELRARLASVERVVGEMREIVESNSRAELIPYQQNEPAFRQRLRVLITTLASLPPSGEGKAEPATASEFSRLQEELDNYKALASRAINRELRAKESLDAATAREAGMREALEKIAKADGPSFPIAFARCVDIARAALAAADSAATHATQSESGGAG